MASNPHSYAFPGRAGVLVGLADPHGGQGIALIGTVILYVQGGLR